MTNAYRHIEIPAHSLESDVEVVYRRFVQLTGYPNGEAVGCLCKAAGATRIDPEKVLFMDIETAGLFGSPVFLIGTMKCANGSLMFTQYFARRYDEEKAILEAYSTASSDARLLVTFNGKCFDVPFLRSRARAYGVDLADPIKHLDLLYEARKRYRGELPNCRLQTLENRICGREREDDIPSSLIPTAYDNYIRTGNDSEIASILNHNLYDLLTLADLMYRMWRTE